MIISLNQIRWCLRLCCLVSLLSNSCLAATNSTPPLVVTFSGKRIELPSKDWEAMTNSEVYAENFSSFRKGTNEAFHQVITIFKLEMSASDRTGVKISKNEYVEIFSALPKILTVLIRREKNGYWVLSRQSFVLDENAPAPARYNYSANETKLLILYFQREIDRTRFLLAETF